MTDYYYPILGLPRSGKTTFLAAFWHVLDDGEDATRLVLEKLDGNRDYLNKIAAAWRRCEEVPRTSLMSETQVSIHTHDKQSGRKMVLGFPDLSGESFELQFGGRSCTRDYLESFNDAKGAALFINADRGLDGISVIDMNAMMGLVPDTNANNVAAGMEPADEVGGLGLAAGKNPEGADEQPKIAPWSPKFVPQQAQLVDILQFLQDVPFARDKRKLAIIISAWDVVLGSGKTPEQWLAGEMPLLDQFLRNNRDSFETSIFGVSAQGGSVKSSDRKALLAEVVPAKKIKCIVDGIDTNDITLPIAWLCGG